MGRDLSAEKAQHPTVETRGIQSELNRPGAGAEMGRIISNGKCFNKTVPSAQLLRLNRSFLLQLVR